MSAPQPLEPLPPSLEHRVHGAVYGALVGDALGVPYEFHAPDDLPPRDLLEMEPPAGFRRAHGGVPIGTWSDDGALLLALLDSLTSVAALSVDDFARKMLAWLHEGHYTPDGKVFDVGVQTSAALGRIAKGTPAAQAGAGGVLDNGNGALMRVLPAAIVATTDEQAVAIARVQGLPTHAHLTSQLCCALYVLVARRLLEGAAFDRAYASAFRDLPAFLEPHESMALSVLLAERKPGSGRGYVVDSLWSAFDCVASTGTYEEAVRAAIALGHDTDTTACIAGGLAGALYGLEGIPKRWMEALRGRELVDELLTRVC